MPSEPQYDFVLHITRKDEPTMQTKLTGTHSRSTIVKILKWLTDWMSDDAHFLESEKPNGEVGNEQSN